MSLAAAVAALIEVDTRIDALIDARIAEIDQTPRQQDLYLLDKSINRLCGILAPVTPRGPDIHITRTGAAIPVRRVEARLWAGIITNPGGVWGVSERGRKRSVYMGTDSADSHGVHYADFDAQ
jgi:hypothetical protein